MSEQEEKNRKIKYYCSYKSTSKLPVDENTSLLSSLELRLSYFPGDYPEDIGCYTLVIEEDEPDGYYLNLSGVDILNLIDALNKLPYEVIKESLGENNV